MMFDYVQKHISNTIFKSNLKLAIFLQEKMEDCGNIMEYLTNEET